MRPSGLVAAISSFAQPDFDVVLGERRVGKGRKGKERKGIATLLFLFAGLAANFQRVRLGVYLLFRAITEAGWAGLMRSVTDINASSA